MSQPDSVQGGRSAKRDLVGGSTFAKSGRDENERKYKDKDRSKYSGGSGYSYGPRSRQAALDVNPHTILLKTRTNETSSLSPGPVKSLAADPSVVLTLSKNFAPRENAGHAPTCTPASMKMLSDDFIFQDGLAEYLSENPDFLVIGFVGLQWSGKSTVSSHLAASNEFVKQSVFNISTTNFQMKGETATSGIDAYICNDRTIWLDCQPLLSAAVIERELASAYSKDVYKESSLKFETSCIGTQVEVQSLQILSFLYCICHVLVVVQDSLADPNLIRLLQTAEMLKPNMSSDESSHDHMPHLVILYNRAQPSDLIPDMLGKAYKFHKQAFSKSRLGISSSLTKGHPLLATHDHDINYVPLLDFVVTDSLWSSYHHVIPALKRALLSLPRNAIIPAGLSEKSWFLFANRAWEAVRKSSLMMEYARLLH